MCSMQPMTYLLRFSRSVTEVRRRNLIHHAVSLMYHKKGGKVVRPPSLFRNELHSQKLPPAGNEKLKRSISRMRMQRSEGLRRIILALEVRRGSEVEEPRRSTSTSPPNTSSP